jgi:hypothetical protein
MSVILRAQMFVPCFIFLETSTSQVLFEHMIFFFSVSLHSSSIPLFWKHKFPFQAPLLFISHVPRRFTNTHDLYLLNFSIFLSFPGALWTHMFFTFWISLFFTRSQVLYKHTWSLPAQFLYFLSFPGSLWTHMIFTCSISLFSLVSRCFMNTHDLYLLNFSIFLSFSGAL